MSHSAPSSLTRHLSVFLGGDDQTARLAVELAIEATLSGHLCADLDQEAGWGAWASEMDPARRSAFRVRLQELAIVGGPGDWTPLVWDGRRLSLRRYWSYEQQLADDLLERSQGKMALDPVVDAKLQTFFPDSGQRAAARSALTSRLTLISGGPGTGKTTTLAGVIGLLHEQAACAGSPPPRIALAAPTGKAAARMAEALKNAGGNVEASALTLHRLLGMRADGNGYRHRRLRPLPLDVLVVDEASMIDVSLMAHMLDALPHAARLVMLGDRDQLAAVEAGAVFADLCASEALGHCVTTLTTIFRFDQLSGIGQLASLVRIGDAEGVLALLRSGVDGIAWQSRENPSCLASVAMSGYRAYREGVAAGLPADQLFALFGRFRVLCAHRQDVIAINQALNGGDGLSQPQSGMPVMVVRNDPLLHLFNGDIGLVLPDPADGILKVCFRGGQEEGQLRWIPFARLPEWEPAWAMTVHKAQGSEFARVVLVLPESISPLVTRELLYTGVTRAREAVSLIASETVLVAAIGRRAERMSGLRAKLAEVVGKQ